ncbi:hypothetical protein RB653_003101 [Dictyostelium firmibasis]|uniref:Doublecortin domain-containing protein n=1 Tax=Dictyostelium firmibasis TaxID=79012 RepID=A0AAN7UBC7_9MYCE
MTSTPGKPKMEKFGLQTDKSARVILFRNGDRYHVEGVQCIVHSSKFKTFDQLKLEFSKKVGLFTGNVQKVYSMDKKRIQDVNEFIDGHHYICCGAEPLNTEVIPKGIQDIFGKAEVSNNEDGEPKSSSKPFVSSVPPPPPPPPSSSTTTPSLSTSPSVSSQPPKKPVVSAYKESAVHSIDKFSVQTEKAKVIMCFRNGDKHHSGERATVHSTKFKTYDQLKEQLSKQVKLPTGPVRKLYLPSGKLIKTMEEIIDGEYYVCAGGETLSQEFSPTLLEHIKQKKLQEQQQSLEQQKPQEQEMF